MQVQACHALTPEDSDDDTLPNPTLPDPPTSRSTHVTSNIFILKKEECSDFLMLEVLVDDFSCVLIGLGVCLIWESCGCVGYVCYLCGIFAFLWFQVTL